MKNALGKKNIFGLVMVLLLSAMLFLGVPIGAKDVPIITVPYLWADMPVDVNGPFQNWLAENKGFRIKFVWPTWDPKQWYSLQAAAHTLPDLFFYYSDIPYFMQQAQYGMFVPLNKYIKDKKNYPTMASIPKSLYYLYTDDKKNTWCVPGADTFNMQTPTTGAKIRSQGSSTWYPRYLIEGYRKAANKPTDWFPQWVDEYNAYIEWACTQKTLEGKPIYAVLPNANTATTSSSILNPYGIRFSGDVYQDTKGRFVWAYATKNMFNSFKLMYKWKKMGILDPETFTVGARGHEIEAQQKSWQGQYAVVTGIIALDKFAPERRSDYAVIPGPTPIDPSVPAKNRALLGWMQPCGWIGMAITKDSKYPDVAAKVLDWINSPEGTAALCFGIPGVDWKWAKPPVNGGDSHVIVLDSGQKLGSEWAAPEEARNKYGINMNITVHFHNGANIVVDNAPATDSALDKEFALKEWSKYPELKTISGGVMPAWYWVRQTDPTIEEFSNFMNNEWREQINSKVWNAKTEADMERIYKEEVQKVIPRAKENIAIAMVEYKKALAMKLGIEKYTAGMGRYELFVNW